MRTLVLSLASLLFGLMLHSQNDLTVFSEEGKTFFLTVNGVQLNSDPMARVTAYDVREGGAAVLIRFSEGDTPDISQRMTFFNPETEVTGMITLTKKGYKLKYFGEKPRVGSTVAAPVNPVIETRTVQVVEPVQERAVNTTQVQTVSTSSTGSAVNANGESISMNVGIDGFNMNVDVNVQDPDMIDHVHTSTTTTTTTTTTMHVTEPVVVHEYYDDVEVEVVNCRGTAADHTRIAAALENESFEDDRLAVAEQAMVNTCFTVDQVKALAEQFTFEENRLSFVKSAYAHCSDPQNYYELNSAFTFSDSKEELDTFLKSQR
jgi:hypothetical protein